MATVENNIKKTAEQTKVIATLAHDLGIKVVFGGEGIQFIPSVKKVTDFTFQSYHDLKQIII